jgi:hypothetical protein
MLHFPHYAGAQRNAKREMLRDAVIPINDQNRR